MRFALLCKRHYTNRDLFADRFGRLYHLPSELARLGHSGTIVAADYRSSQPESLAESALEFRSLPCSPRHGLRFVAESFAMIARARPQALIASGDIHFGALGRIFARRLGIPLVFDVYDDYSAFGAAKIPGMSMIFRHALRQADLVVSASVPLAEQLRRFNRAVTVIENGVDASRFRPIDKAAARAQLGIGGGETVIGFFGSIAKSRGIEQLIEAVRIVIRSRPRTRLLLAGANRLGLPLDDAYIDYRGTLAHDEIPVLINACDVTVIPYLPDPQVDMSNACKIAEYVACGVPVVTTRVSNFEEIFAATPQAVCEPGDVAGMAAAILRQLAAPQILPFDEQSLTWSALAAKLELELGKLLDEPGAARRAAS